jgi:hypothetical protein
MQNDKPENCPSMHTGVFHIKINQFRPLGGVMPINATISMPLGHDPVFKVRGNNIFITLPEGDTSDVELVFRLFSNDYLLIGITFTDPEGGVGKDEFPMVVLEPDIEDPNDDAYRKMTVRDAHEARDKNIFYSYVILVQDTKTGEVGIIDPGIGPGEDE